MSLLKNLRITGKKEMTLSEQQTQVLTWTHEQGETNLCWLQSRVTTIKQAMKIKASKLSYRGVQPIRTMKIAGKTFELLASRK